MTGWKLVAAWASAVVFGVALIGLGVFFVTTGLDDADQWASVIGVFATLIGLGLSVYGVVLARRGLRQPVGPGRLTLDRVRGRRGVDVVEAVAGDVRYGVSAPARATPTAPAGVPTPGEQSLTDVSSDGTVRVFRGVGGDLDVAP